MWIKNTGNLQRFLAEINFPAEFHIPNLATHYIIDITLLVLSATIFISYIESIISLGFS